MSATLLSGTVEVLRKVTTSEAAMNQLNRIRSKADRQWVLAQLDPAQRRRIENGFKPSVDDWVELPKGVGVISRIKDGFAEVYLYESDYSLELNAKQFEAISDWFPINQIKLIDCPDRYKQDYEQYLKFKQLPEEDKVIEEFLLVIKLARSDEDLTNAANAIRQMYTNKEISKDSVLAIYEAIPPETKQRIDEIKKKAT